MHVPPRGRTPRTVTGRVRRAARAIGFEPVHPCSARSLGDWTTAGSSAPATQVHLAVSHRRAGGRCPPSAMRPFVVAPLAAGGRAPRRAGFDVSERRRHWGSRRVVVAAPAGHRVELMETPPGQAASGAARRSRRVDFVASSAPCATRSKPSPRPSGAALEPHFTQPRPARVRAVEPARDGQGRAVRPLLALPGHAAAALPRRVRRRRPRGGRALRRRRGRAGRAALRADLPRLRRRLGRPARRRPHRLRVGVSNILTKVLQRGRLAAYLEQSTRYIPYDTPMAEARRARRAAGATGATRSSARSSARRWTSSSRSTRER